MAKERDAGRAKGAKGKDTEARAEQNNYVGKSKGKGKGHGGKGVYGLDLMGTDSRGADGAWAASNLGEIKVTAMSNGENMMEPDISDRWPR